MSGKQDLSGNKVNQEEMFVMTLYHATYKENVEKIMREGLRRNQPVNFQGMSMEGMLYFAFDPEAAISFIESADTYEGQEIAVLSVDTADLELNKINYDWNNRCEYHENIISLAYSGDVPASALSKLNQDEIAAAPYVTIDDMETLDDDSNTIWNKLLDIFEEEVETNLEFEQKKRAVNSGLEDIEYNFSLMGVKDIPQNNPHHIGSLAEHTAAVVDAVYKLADEIALSLSETERLAAVALLHDIGKPEVVNINGITGYDQFIGHADRSAEILEAMDPKLFESLTGLNVGEKREVAALVRLHDSAFSKQGKILKMLEAHPDGFARDLLAIKLADIEGRAILRK